METLKAKRYSFANWKTTITSAIIGLSLYYLLGYIFSPQNFSFEDISVTDVVYFLTVDQLLIEVIYIFLLLKLMEVYMLFFRLDELNQVSNLNYILKWVPFFGGIFFLINPITQSLRYLVRFGFDIDLSVLINEYWFSLSLYMLYTIIGVIVGVIVLLWNVRFENVGLMNLESVTIRRLVGEHKAIMKPISVEEICWVEVKNRKYWVVTPDKELRIFKTLSELEKQLPAEQFIRINRSAIINLAFIDSYSSWGNGSFLLEMKHISKKEFIISRNQVKKFKVVMKV